MLGSLLTDPDAIKLVKAVLAPDDFSDRYHESVYQAMLAIDEQGLALDVLTVSDAITARGGNSAPLLDMINATPTSVHVMHYAKIVAELAERRRGMEAAAQIAQLMADESLDMPEIRAQSYNRLRAVSDRRDGAVQNSADAALAFSDDLDRWVESPRDTWGFSTGLRDLDKLTGGLEREMVIIGGRPSHGKTALMTQIAYHIAKGGAGVVFFSLEMPVKAMIYRLACFITGMDSMRVRRGELQEGEQSALYGALAQIGKLPIYWSDRGAITVPEMGAEVAKLAVRQNISAVVVDYIQLVNGGRRDNRNLELGEISRGLHLLCREQGVLMLVGSQLNRAVEGRDEQVPRLADLRESGNIEQDADKVIFVHRPELRYRAEMKPVPPDLQGKAQLILAKNRNGIAGVGLRDMVFIERCYKFADAVNDCR